MHTIVVPVDLSSESSKALPVAKELAKSTSATLKIVSFFCYPFSSQSIALVQARKLQHPETVEDEITHLRQDVETLCQKCLPGIAYEHEVVLTKHATEDAIVQYAAEHHATYIVMASHGRGGLRKALSGSVTYEVIRKSTCPVVVVPPGTSSSSGSLSKDETSR